MLVKVAMNSEVNLVWNLCSRESYKHYLVVTTTRTTTTLYCYQDLGGSNWHLVISQSYRYDTLELPCIIMTKYY